MDKAREIATNLVKDPTQIANLISTHKAEMLSLIAIVMIIVIIIALFTWFGSLMTRESRICNTMNTLYNEKDSLPKSKSLHTGLALANPYPGSRRFIKLRDFYIKTAYNCCSAGDFKNSFVNTCALKNCIKQGARCLDFEIYSIDNKPAIATSTLDSCKIKETYNSVPFGDAMSVIESMAFDTSVTPFANDPLLLNLRLKSCPDNVELFTSMEQTLQSMFSKRLLGREYGKEYRVLRKSETGENVYYHFNLGEMPIVLLLGKVIIMVDRVPSSVKNCDKPLGINEPRTPPCRFYDFVNIAGDGGFLEVKRFSELTSAPSAQDLVDECKNKLCICLPDLSNYPSNINFSLCKSYGIQMIAMCFQNFDTNMENCDLFFNGLGADGENVSSDAGAFIKKPEIMLAPVIPMLRQRPQNKNLSSTPIKLTPATAGAAKLSGNAVPTVQI